MNEIFALAALVIAGIAVGVAISASIYGTDTLREMVKLKPSVKGALKRLRENKNKWHSDGYGGYHDTDVVIDSLSEDELERRRKRLKQANKMVSLAMNENAKWWRIQGIETYLDGHDGFGNDILCLDRDPVDVVTEKYIARKYKTEEIFPPDKIDALWEKAKKEA